MGHGNNLQGIIGGGMKTKIITILLGVLLAFPGMAIADEIVINGVAQTPSASITGGTIDGTVIGGTTPAAGSFTDLSASGTLGGRLNRDFAKTSMTNGDTQTAFSEANMLATKYLTNQGETVELDVIFVAVSYPIGGVISNEEAQVVELCPPSGEIIYLDGVALDADDCVDSDGVVGSLASYLRFQDGSAAWHYHILSITGAWTDTGATD